MEVHHHPEVEKKGFKEYLLEGLMIFVAVTMGFFAESIRENITNKEHVQQLCRGFVQELRSDTARLDKVMAAHQGYVKNDDSLLVLLQQPMAGMDTRKLQQLIGNSYSIKLFQGSSGSINAIKSELHLKQFSSSGIANYISDYQFEEDIVKHVEDLELQHITSHIQPFCEAHFTTANMSAYFFSKNQRVADGRLRNLKQDDIEQLGVNVSILKVLHLDAIEHQDSVKQEAVRLIKYINDRFGLDEK